MRAAVDAALASSNEGLGPIISSGAASRLTFHRTLDRFLLTSPWNVFARARHENSVKQTSAHIAPEYSCSQTMRLRINTFQSCQPSGRRHLQRLSTASRVGPKDISGAQVPGRAAAHGLRPAPREDLRKSAVHLLGGLRRKCPAEAASPPRRQAALLRVCSASNNSAPWLSAACCCLRLRVCRVSANTIWPPFTPGSGIILLSDN